MGSSYSNENHTKLTEEEHLSNLKNLKLISDGDMVINSGKAGLRAVAKDHMPIVGKKNGLYINTCHGSRASVTAPISAEIISNLIANEAPPLMKRELEHLSPERFS